MSNTPEKDIRRVFEAIGRPLTEQEHAVIKWLLGWESETVETINGLFDAFWRAGQADANLAHEVLSGAFDTDNHLQEVVNRAIEDLGDIIDLEPLEGHVRGELTEIVGYLSNSGVDRAE